MEQAMAVPLGIAQVIYEASTLVNAASMMHCIGRS
jgi:gamma-glutamyl phosphate reductase